MDYGHFSEDGREYLITRTPTPRAWENFAANAQYGLKIDAAGGGYSLLPVAPGNRVTFASEGEPFGKVFYLRDRDSGRHWSLTWQPVGGERERFVCRHGVGYTVFEMVAEGIETSLRVFVPVEDPVEIWTARVKNTGREARRLTLFPYVEWYLAPHMKPWDNYRNYLEAHWVETEEGVIAARLWDPAAPGKYYSGFAAVDRQCAGYDTQHEVFMGSGTTAAPAAVVEGSCRGSDMPGDGRAIAAFQIELDLEPGQEEEVTLVVGCGAEGEEASRLREVYLKPGRAEEEFARLRAGWEKVFEQPRIETPDARLDRMTNIWLKANVLQLTRVLREGLRGYRDNLQDAMGVVSFDPECARATILTALSYQYPEGHAPRQFCYNRGPHDLRVYNDSPLWIVLALARYLKETGDLALLEEVVPFFESEEEGSVFEHARRAVEWIDARRGWHGLIRIDRGDWCDALDHVGLEGKGVSVWLSQAFHLGLLEFAEICELRGEKRAAEGYGERAKELWEALQEQAWDGEWYLCAISDPGRRLGAKGATAMEIYLNTQSWAVIGRAGEPERIRRALEAADARLDSRFGPLLLAPPYEKHEADVGRLSICRPGCCENGTVYVHAAVFYFLANLMARRPDRAVEILRAIAPMMEAQDPEVTQAPPYAYVNSYAGPCSPEHEGRTLTSWYTSSPSWTLFAITDWMLGVRATHEGLEIDPCLPADWEKATLRRRWRGAEYEVVIAKPKGVVEGALEVVVDGERLAGNVVPPHGDGRLHRVEVRMR